MNENKCQEVYTRLESLLRAHRLDWVVDLVAGEISLGKTLSQATVSGEDRQQVEEVPFQLTILEEVPDEIVRTPRRGPDLVVEEYSEREKLEILINTIIQAVVDTTLMENRVTTFFYNSELFANSNARVRFIANMPNDQSFELSRGDSAERIEIAIDLLNLLEQLRREIYNNGFRR
jgi:hypothetical protein